MHSMIQFIPFNETVAQIETGLAEHNLTVADLCRKAGIAQTTWGRWKGGKFEPRDTTKKVVIEAYNELVGAGQEAAAS